MTIWWVFLLPCLIAISVSYGYQELFHYNSSFEDGSSTQAYIGIDREEVLVKQLGNVSRRFKREAYDRDACAIVCLTGTPSSTFGEYGVDLSSRKVSYFNKSGHIIPRILRRSLGSSAIMSYHASRVLPGGYNIERKMHVRLQRRKIMPSRNRNKGNWPHYLQCGEKIRRNLLDACAAPNERKAIYKGFAKISRAAVGITPAINVSDIYADFMRDKGFIDKKSGNMTAGTCRHDKKTRNKICGTCWQLPILLHGQIEGKKFFVEPVCFAAIVSQEGFFKAQLLVHGKQVAENKLRLPQFVQRIQARDRHLYMQLNLTPLVFRPLPTRLCLADRDSSRDYFVELISCYLLTIEISIRLNENDPAVFDLDLYACSVKDVSLRGVRPYKIFEYNIKCIWLQTGVIKNPQYWWPREPNSTKEQRSRSNEYPLIWDEKRGATLAFEGGAEKISMPIESMKMKNVTEIAPSLITLLDKFDERIDEEFIELNPRVTKGKPSNLINWEPTNVKSNRFLAILYSSPLPTPLTKKTLEKELPGFEPIVEFFSEDLAKNEHSTDDVNAYPDEGETCGGVFIASNKVLTICACIRYFYAYHKHVAVEPKTISAFEIPSADIYVTFADRSFTIDQAEYKLETDRGTFMKDVKCFRAIENKADANILQTMVVAMQISPHLPGFKQTPLVPWLDEEDSSRKNLQADMVVLGLTARRRNDFLFDASRNVMKLRTMLVKTFFDECRTTTTYCQRIPYDDLKSIPTSQRTKCLCARDPAFQLCGSVIGFPLMTQDGIVGLSAKPIHCKENGSVLAVVFSKEDLDEASPISTSAPSSTSAPTPSISITLSPSPINILMLSSLKIFIIKIH